MAFRVEAASGLSFLRRISLYFFTLAFEIRGVVDVAFVVDSDWISSIWKFFDYGSVFKVFNSDSIY